MSTALNHYVTAVLSRRLQEDMRTSGPTHTPARPRRSRERRVR